MLYTVDVVYFSLPLPSQLQLQLHMANPNPLSLLPHPLLLQLHAHLLTTGLAAASPQFPPPIILALNSLIRFHSKSPTPHLAFRFFRLLPRPDRFSLTFLARSSAHLSPSAVTSAHAAALRRGLAADPHVATALLHSYSAHRLTSSAEKLFTDIKHPDHVAQTAMLRAFSASGKLAHARKLFDEMPHRDTIAWNAMLAGYSQSERNSEALQLFDEMLADGVRVMEPTLVPVLSACAGIGALQQGRWVHSYVRTNNLHMTVTLGTALVDMYFKCGSLTLGMEVFRGMRERNVYTWSCVVGGLAMNGAGRECLEMFRVMEGEGVAPNEVTFTSALHGCSVRGLVEEGKEVFASIRGKYGMEPTLENYGCMVDLYARAGMLQEAVDFIEAMPLVPHAEAWGALLNGCRLHGNTELGEFAARKIVELQSWNEGPYVLMSNIYANSKNWKEVSSERKLMNARSVKKEVGCSAIGVDGDF